MKTLPAEMRAPLAAAGMRIGLLGGSFNPAHQGHRDISLTALKRLGLDQVWWLVTGNPLKGASGLPSLSSRVAAAKEVARHPRIAVTGFAGGQSGYTIDLLKTLKRRFPAVNFVWLMGADNLAQFARWRAWPEIFALTPIAVLDRPGFRLKARASKAAQRFNAYYVDESDAAGLAFLVPPAWTIVSHKLSPLSSTALRDRTKQMNKEEREAKSKPSTKPQPKKEKAKEAKKPRKAKAPAKTKSSAKPKAKTAKAKKDATKKAARRVRPAAKPEAAKRHGKTARGKAKPVKKKRR